jgi:hypothetical protein
MKREGITAPLFLSYHLGYHLV